MPWVHITGTAPKIQVSLAHVSVTGDWTLVFHEHLKRATGKAAAPNNLQASETHLLIYALQVLIHHLLPFVMYKACCSAITFIHAQHIRNAMSHAVHVVTECDQHSDIPDPF